MADEGRGDAVSLIKRLLEGEDDQHSVDITLYLADPMLLPCPELGADEKDYGDAQAMKLAGEAEIDVGEIDEDGGVGPGFLNAALELAVFAVDAGHVEDHFGDAHDGDVFGADDAVKTGGFHALTPEPEEGCFGS